MVRPLNVGVSSTLKPLVSTAFREMTGIIIVRYKADPEELFRRLL